MPLIPLFLQPILENTPDGQTRARLMSFCSSSDTFLLPISDGGLNKNDRAQFLGLVDFTNKSIRFFYLMLGRMVDV